MALSFEYPTPLPSTRGWGPGWPGCQSQFVVSHPVFVGGVRKEIEELVDLLVVEMVERGYKFKTPGCWGYGCRATKGGSGDVPSFHSWGLAIDINAPDNPFGAPTNQNMPQWVVKLMRDYGFFWLGPPIKDWMHFSFVGSPADARRLTEKARKELGDVKYEEFEDGVRAYWANDPEPTKSGPKKFGWNFARRAETRPGPVDHDHTLEDHRHRPGSVEP